MALPAIFTTANLDEIKQCMSSWRSFTKLLSGRTLKRISQSQGTNFQKIKEHNLDYGDPKVCPICLEEIDLSDMAMKCPNNGHFFHQKCLSEWLVHQLSPFEGRSFAEGGRRPLGTCPICREELTRSASKLESYLRDPNYKNDDRPIVDKVKFRLRMYMMFFFADRKTFLRSVTGVFVFMFGVFKGFTLKSWTFMQDVVYFTLPNRLRLVTTVGYLVGLLLRTSYYLYEAIRHKNLN